MSYKLYPITQTQLQHSGYTVKVNGQEVSLDTARVSAFPMNRRWPGHQRTLDQTELINFLSLETDEPLTFEITPNEPFETAQIRPSSMGIVPEIIDGTIRFTMEKPAYFTVEPFGRHNALHIFADPLSSYDIDKNDPNVLYFGPGEHDVGMIYLKSGQTLFIDEGAVVYTCVRAMDADNIQILGRGILDNSRNKAQILFETNAEHNTAAVLNAKRLHNVQLEYCTNVRIEGVTMRDSLLYNIRPVGCTNLNISNVKIIGCWRFNSDGIDMHNCVNVNIDNCFIRTFDDCICVKGFDLYTAPDVAKAWHDAEHHNGKVYNQFRNVRVTNCTLWNDWGKCLEIGAETKANDICSILFENCSIIRGIGPVLDCMNVDNADIYNVRFQNISIDYDEENPKPMIQQTDDQKFENVDPNYLPRTIRLHVTNHPEYSKGSPIRGRIRDFVFDNIRVYGKHAPRFYFEGYDETHKVSNVVVSNLYHNDQPVAPDGYLCEIKDFCENIQIKL